MAWQAAQKEAVDAKNKRAEKARRRHKKEKEIAQWVRASKNQSDVEAELESEEPMEMGGDTSSFKDDGDRGVIATSVEHRAPTATPISGGRDTKRHGDVLASRTRATDLDAAVD